ncbi:MULTISPECIES: major capsid protein [unclassified Oceanobacillus]|uniref:major capsid protein n=1 Tax=unclassified Oceanobacillus TaxID=2630292 RepID=UPI001BE687D3|nr:MULTISPECIES: major capsid protein [unclassified Oceanobacillus]MBT2599091.1 coat protein [Oceanobacillus sp. ISL-74]MBT2652009.1 coat protein [Oceanobacillus sp. ISL-73]
MPTRIADVIQPEVFNDYIIQRTTEQSALINSGIIEVNSEFGSLASGPNTLVNMPFWNDLTGDAETIKDQGDLTAGKITSSKDVARKQGRARMWGANGLSSLLSGDDPMGAIGQLVANYWIRQDQAMLLSTLDGIFKSTNMTSKVLDITGETGTDALLDGDSFIDAGQLMGDAKGLLTGVMMHSAVEAYLAKRDLIEYVQESAQSDRVPYFMNKRVIVDDGMPYDTTNKVSSIYLFGSGAIAKGVGSHPNIISTEVDRNKRSSSGEDFLINRNIQILHPRGVRWNEKTVSGEFPTNAELATGTNWTRVYEPKTIRIVKCNFHTEVQEQGTGGE